MNLLMTLSSTPVVSTKTRLHNFCSFILIKEMFSLAWKTIPLLFEDINKKKPFPIFVLIFSQHLTLLLTISFIYCLSLLNLLFSLAIIFVCEMVIQNQ